MALLRAMAPGARRRRGETAVPSASAKEAGRAPPGGGGGKEAGRALSLLRATPRDPPHARHPRCPLRPGRGPKRRRDVTIAPAASVGFYGFYGGRSDFGVRPGSTAQGETTTRGRFRRSRRDRAPPRALDPWRRRSLRGRPSPRRGLRDVSREPAVGDAPDARDAPPTWRSALMPISRTTTVGARRAPPSGRPQGRHPRLPGPFPRSTSSSRDRRREPRAPGVRRGPSPPPERAAHRRTAPRLRARVQDADFLAPRPPLPDASTPSTGRLPEPPPRVHHPPTRANPRRQPHPSDPPPPPSPPLPRVVVLVALLRRLPVVVGRRPPRFVAVVFPERIFPRHPSRSRGSFSFRRGCAR